MAELKTQKTKASVTAFLASLKDPDQRKEAKALAAIFRRATKKAPAMWGTAIVGYGEMTYQGSSGRGGVWFPVGFSPRSAALTVYLMGGMKAHADLLAKLGPHKVGGGCLYIRHLADVEPTVLARLITKSYATNAGKLKTFTRAKPAAKKRSAR